jgi:hypothetical protein
MTRELLKTGNHAVTAISRADSKSEIPEGVKVAKVNYEDSASLVKALQGQDALIITLSVWAPKDYQSKLIKAAADANVPWVLPNEWSPDTAAEGLVQDVMPFQKMPKAREEIKQYGKSSYIAISTGFWYEWSLAIGLAYGFDFQKRSITFFDDGKTLISTSTWPQVGRAVAALLSLPIQAKNGKSAACLDNYRDQHVYIKSFTVSQKDIFESVLRVTKTKPEDWSITYEPVKERYANGNTELQQGNRTGFAKMMYSRVFYPDGVGNFEKTRGTLNDVLGLPKENIDEATEVAAERSKNPPF